MDASDAQEITRPPARRIWEQIYPRIRIKTSASPSSKQENDNFLGNLKGYSFNFGDCEGNFGDLKGFADVLTETVAF